jgi:hypothetical protein
MEQLNVSVLDEAPQREELRPTNSGRSKSAKEK